MEVQVPELPLSTSSLKRRRLVVDTDTTADAVSHPLSLLRSLSATSPSQSQSVSAVPREPQSSPAATRQMSCPEPSQMQQRVDFTSDCMELNRWLRCVVSHIDDPENFYCQLNGNNDAEQLETLMTRIDKHITSLPPGIGKLRGATLGQPVIARYSQDGAWYRARVTGTHCFASCPVFVLGAVE